MDPNHDVFVGPVGTWMPWEPEAYRTGRVEYLEEELNQLMHEKNKNEKHDRERCGIFVLSHKAMQLNDLMFLI